MIAFMGVRISWLMFAKKFTLYATRQFRLFFGLAECLLSVPAACCVRRDSDPAMNTAVVTKCGSYADRCPICSTVFSLMEDFLAHSVARCKRRCECLA